MRNEVIMSDAENAAAPAETGGGRRSPWQRTGCALAVLLWAVLMMIPFLLLVLALRGEVAISTGDAPGQQMRVWLIMDAAQRGVGISTAAASETGDNVCVQTEVRFLLWQGQAEAPQTYCECYQRGTDGDWRTASVSAKACPAN
jgi:hypothetical protein